MWGEVLSNLREAEVVVRTAGTDLVRWMQKAH